MSISNGHGKVTQDAIAEHQAQCREIRELCRRAGPHNNTITPLIEDLDNQVLSPNARKKALSDLESCIIPSAVLTSAKLGAGQIEPHLGELSLLLEMIERMEKIGDTLQTQYKEEKSNPHHDSQRLECLRLACNFTTKYVCLGCGDPVDKEDSKDCDCGGRNIPGRDIRTSQGPVTWNQGGNAKRLSPSFPGNGSLYKLDRPQYPVTFSYETHEWNNRFSPEMLKRTRPYYTLAAIQDAASTVEGPEIDFNNYDYQYIYMIERRDHLWLKVRKVISSVDYYIAWMREKLEAGVTGV